MSRVRAKSALWCLMLTLVHAHGAAAQIPEGWEIVEITNDPAFFDNAPDINDRGQVVFMRTVAPSLDLQTAEVMLYDRCELIQLTDDDVYDGLPKINNHGDIVWARDLEGDGDTDIVLWRDGELTPIANEPYYEQDADIDDAGRIVWHGFVTGNGNVTQVFLSDGFSTEVLVDNGLMNQGFENNGLGDIVWARYNFFVSPWTSEIMLYTGEAFEQVTSGHGQVQSPDTNDLRHVVWASSQTGVELWVDGITTQIVEDGGGPRINNADDVSVARWDALCGNHELWLVRDGQLIQLTDGCYGGSKNSINNRGEIAFRYGSVADLQMSIALFTKPSFVADVDFDGDVDLQDFALVQGCFGTDGAGSCWGADLNADGAVDLTDFSAWSALIAGPR